MGHPKMKTVYTLNINNYLPDLCEITLPTINAYANRIGAKFEVITERKFPGWPITYEKLQLCERAKDNDWTIFVDADTVIGSDLPDLTKMVKPNIIGVHMAYDADKTLPNEYFMIQDRRNVGVVTSFMVVPKACHKIWTPLEEDVKSALRRLSCVDAVDHIVDEYCISRNLARYRFNFIGLTQLCDGKFLHLSATVENKDIINKAKEFVNAHVKPE